MTKKHQVLSGLNEQTFTFIYHILYDYRFYVIVSARMRCRGDVRKGADLQPPNGAPGGGGAGDPVALGDGGVDSVGPSLVLPSGKPICPSALPPGDRRAALQRAILTQDTER